MTRTNGGVLGNIMISTFMVVLDSTIVNTALPKIMASYGISVDIAQWILTAYMLAFAVTLPTSGGLPTGSAISGLTPRTHRFHAVFTFMRSIVE